MKPKQVLSVEQMIHLQELGLSTSDGSMCFEWNESDADNMVVTGQCKNLRGKFINCYLCLQIHSLWS